MTDQHSADQPEIRFSEIPKATRVDLMAGGRSVSRLWIVPFRIRIGAVVVRMDGIGGVETDQDHRHRGYARRVLEAAVDRMIEGEAALSMLYGIPRFYPKFGFATAGPDHFISLTRLSDPPPLPSGWTSRPAMPVDLPALRRLYDDHTVGTVGAAVRAAAGGVWAKLEEAAEGRGPDECRVVLDPAGTVAAYAWRARGFWYLDGLERRLPDALVIGEAIAGEPHAADALLAACRLWAREESAARERPVERVCLALPPAGLIASAAMRQSALFEQRFALCGESMARVLSTPRLLDALRPELNERLKVAGEPPRGCWLLETTSGAAVLSVDARGLTVEQSAGEQAGCATVIRLPQETLARLALGAFPPGDLLSRLEEPPEAESRRLLEVLFPYRHPHMYLPDRF
jgi:hypothetical protein